MLKVIIADDEILICRLVQTLADWDVLGMEVAGFAQNGLEALELIRQEQPDVLITDIRMPGCDGLTLIQRAKELHPDLEIVIISGYAHFEYAQTAMRYGVGDYLLKPIKKTELMETLEKIRGRCLSKLASQKELIRQHQNNESDRNRIRESLIRDLLSEHPPVLTEAMLRDTYYILASGGVYQAFLLKIDFDGKRTSESALRVVVEKAAEIMENKLSDICQDVLIYFEAYHGYGIVHYEAEQKGNVRTVMRDGLNLLDGKKGLFGSVEFSVGLGGAVTEPSMMSRSLEEAKSAVAERLLEGSGRIFEHVPKGGNLDKAGLLDRYAKAVEHSLETLNPEEAGQAALSLQDTVLSTDAVSGQEILELVLLAGQMFISRVASQNAEENQKAFLFSCNQCHKAASLFEVLKETQRNLLTEAAQNRQNESMRPIRMAKKYVMEHYREPITLEEVCEAIGFSASYFSMLFKRETGEGFAKYVTRVRIEEAKNLLRDSNLPIAEICEQVGYSDRKHFTQIFHKATGLNPVEYRKLYG